jgi:hypothetical protein
MRRGKIHWAVLVFLLGFSVLLIGVCFYYLYPAMDAARHAATDREKHGLKAYSSLLLAIMLFILTAGLMLTFRFGRFFFPRPTPPRTRTKYVDAWAESGKRMEVPPEED